MNPLTLRAVDHLKHLDAAVQAMRDDLPFEQRAALTQWMIDGYRLLGAQTPPLVPDAAEIERRRIELVGENVTRLPGPVARLVAKGGRINGKSFYEAAVGPGALRCPRTTADEHAAATDDGREPPLGAA